MAKSNNPEASLGKNKSSSEVATAAPRSTGKSNNSEASLKKSPSHTDPMSEGLYGSKSNGETATLRSGNLPKAEAVRTAKPTAGVAVREAQKQNTNDQGEWPKKRNVVPNKDDESLIVTSIAKIKE